MRISDWSSDVCSSDLIIERPTQGRQPDTAYGKHQSNDCAHRAEDYGRPILPGRCGDRLCHWHPPWLALGLLACPRANEYRPIPSRTPDMYIRSAAVTFGAEAGIRSEERRVGKECVSKYRRRWSPN